MELWAATTIRQPVSRVYGHWRHLENLSTFMTYIDRIRPTGERTSHWTAITPFGHRLEWDAELTDVVPDRQLGWRSVGEAELPNCGRVRFDPAPDGVSTEVRALMVFVIPGTELGGMISRYFGDTPNELLDDDLHRLKQILETGEVVLSDGAPWGKRSRKEFPQRPAQPLSAGELARGAPA
ncbi:hypothetical protein GCM10010399_28420 [Dactylosporangium fulvum]|uniref:SRPBCC family protein n=1 Tax=Dactylosporangium fulvum TaxID=53359 RepID=A0ABY5WAG2_9ACTN|nr:SRPBCC family protein [Dactylosporangium fulvum]UWP86286.1 SRPBCC family protein [Dactylosporangium fulvum]